MDQGKNHLQLIEHHCEEGNLERAGELLEAEVENRMAKGDIQGAFEVSRRFSQAIPEPMGPEPTTREEEKRDRQRSYEKGLRTKLNRLEKILREKDFESALPYVRSVGSPASLDVPRETIEEASAHFWNMSEYSSAGQIFELVGDVDTAAAIYQDAIWEIKERLKNDGEGLLRYREQGKMYTLEKKLDEALRR